MFSIGIGLQSNNRYNRALPADLVIIGTGQSLADHLHSTYSGAGHEALEARAVANGFQSATHYNGAQGSAGLFKSYVSGGSKHFINDDAAEWVTGGDGWTQFTGAVSSAGAANVNAIHINLGQTDGDNASLDPETYLEGLLFLYDAMRAECPNALIFVDIIGQSTGNNDEDAWQSVREKQLEAIGLRSFVYKGAETYDLSRTDTVHLDQAGQEDYGERVADIVSFVYKWISGPQGIYGPAVSGVEAYADTRTIILEFNLDGGSVLNQDTDKAKRVGGNFGVSINGAARVAPQSAQKAPGTDNVYLLQMEDFIEAGDDITVTYPTGTVSTPDPDTHLNNGTLPVRSFVNESATVLADTLAPPRDATALFEYDAATVETSGSDVVSWTDLSGQDNAALPDDNPVYNATGGHNNLPVIQCRGETNTTNEQLTAGASLNVTSTATWVFAFLATNKGRPAGANFNNGSFLENGDLEFRRDADGVNVNVDDGTNAPVDLEKPLICTIVNESADAASAWVNGALMYDNSPFNPREAYYTGTPKFGDI